MSTDSRPAARYSLVEILFAVFMRMMAAACFYFGLRYWDLLIGFSSGNMIRFDVMNVPWRTVAAILAVLYPIISLGLWLGVSWGMVLWVAAAGSEVLMHTVWAGIYGKDDLLVALHLSVAALYVFFRVALYIARRRRRQQVTLDSP